MKAAAVTVAECPDGIPPSPNNLSIANVLFTIALIMIFTTCATNHANKEAINTSF